jgi:hypothetical protein
MRAPNLAERRGRAHPPLLQASALEGVVVVVLMGVNKSVLGVFCTVFPFDQPSSPFRLPFQAAATPLGPLRSHTMPHIIHRKLLAPPGYLTVVAQH